MKKDIMLSICWTQRFEGCDEESMNLVTQARFYKKGDKIYISYEESEITGFTGNRTTIKFDGSTVAIIRSGTYPSELVFAKEQRHIGLYNTEFGALTISTYTKTLENSVNENGGELFIDYIIEVDQSMIGNHSFKMLIK